MNSSNDRIRREMGMDMPTPARDYATERYSVTTKSAQPATSPMYMIVGGVVMVQEEDGWRYATAEEIEQITGGVICLVDLGDGATG